MLLKVRRYLRIRNKAKVRLEKQLSRASDKQIEMFVIMAEWIQDYYNVIGYSITIEVILEIFHEMTGEQ